MRTLKWFVATAVSTLLVGGSALAKNDDYPSRPLTVIVPYGAGSMVDTTTRLVAKELAQKLGKPVVVENRTGANGQIAMNALQNAEADGYTLMVDTPAIAINPSAFEVNYDPSKDVVPIGQLMSLPFVAAVHPDVPASTLTEFVEYVKANPGKLNIAPGGTSTLLASELLKLRGGLEMENIIYRGAAPAVLAVLKNECQVAVFDIANLAPHIQSGKLRGLFVSGDQRSPVLPDVPTAKEAGLDGYDVTTWFGLFAKGGTPPEIVERLNQYLNEILESPQYIEYVKNRGASINKMTTAEFKEFFDNEVKLWADVIEESGVKFES